MTLTLRRKSVTFDSQSRVVGPRAAVDGFLPHPPLAVSVITVRCHGVGRDAGHEVSPAVTRRITCTRASYVSLCCMLYFTGYGKC